MNHLSIARLALAATLVGGALFTAGCAGTGQPDISYDAFADAVPPGEITAKGWTVTLDEAELAFGPAVFCAAASGSATLCETAAAELRSFARLDALDPAPQPLGIVRGFQGEIRSASFDYGIHWFTTEASPAAAAAAPGGHSARFRGRATNGAQTLDFTADVDVIAQYQGQRAVPSVPAEADVGAAPVRLDVRFDVGAWVARIDFGALAEGGATRAEITPGTRAHDALVLAMTAQFPPTFAWSPAP